MPVAAGVVGDVGMRAPLTARNMAAAPKVRKATKARFYQNWRQEAFEECVGSDLESGSQS